ncbi:MAG: hypothetical protein IPM40_00200 [Gammaproteobacteria bacterium]|nr:hypothetical protein [Gammaproteobacteria bacterium]
MQVPEQDAALGNYALRRIKVAPRKYAVCQPPIARQIQQHENDWKIQKNSAPPRGQCTCLRTITTSHGQKHRYAKRKRWKKNGILLRKNAYDRGERQADARNA